jgi:hypothetical protein
VSIGKSRTTADSKKLPIERVRLASADVSREIIDKLVRASSVTATNGDRCRDLSMVHISKAHEVRLDHHSDFKASFLSASRVLFLLLVLMSDLCDCFALMYIRSNPIQAGGRCLGLISSIYVVPPSDKKAVSTILVLVNRYAVRPPMDLLGEDAHDDLMKHYLKCVPDSARRARVLRASVNCFVLASLSLFQTSNR